MVFTIDLVPHMDAGDRRAWSGDQDERPLTDLGRRQANALADALSGGIDAVYAGTALRCRQSVEPLAERFGLTVNVMPELGEKQAWRAPDGWQRNDMGFDPGIWEPTFAAGMMARAIEKLEAQFSNGRIVACSHGHTIPAYVAHACALRGIAVPQLEYRGQWFRVGLDGAGVSIERVDVADFPR